MNRSSLRPGVLIFMLGITSVLGCALDLRTGPEKVHDRYLQAWNEQLRHYHDQYWQQKDNRVRYETSALDQEAWALAAAQIEKGYEIAGRWQALKTFIRHMRTSPGPGMTDSWFVRKVDELNRRARSVNQDLAALEEKPSRTTAGRARAEVIFKWRGWVAGYYKELDSLYRQAMGYFVDLGRANQRQAQQQAQASQALMALGVYLRSQQPYVLDNPTTTCTTWRNTITCN